MTFEVADRRLRRRIKQQRAARKRSRKSKFIGMRFGWLVVVKRDVGEYFVCKCDCGVEKSVQGSNLRSGHAKSCGCRQRVVSDGSRAKIRLAVKIKYERMTPEQRSAPVRKAWVTRRLKCQPSF